MRIGGDGRPGERQRRLVAGASGADRALGKFGRGLEELKPLGHSRIRGSVRLSG